MTMTPTQEAIARVRALGEFVLKAPGGFMLSTEHGYSLVEVAAAAEEAEKLRAALVELVAAGDFAVTCADDMAAMIRFGKATEVARALTEGSK